jgi:hypothetical protein
LRAVPKRFGFDLDNTLIDYSNAVQEYCLNEGLNECKTLDSLRTLLRRSDPSGRLWQLAQGWLYTDGLSYARAGQGAIELCEFLKDSNMELMIVSHKTTRTPDFCGQKPLREIATKWINSSELADYFLGNEQIYYEATRASKVERIQKLGFNYFVDDLIEVFQEPAYPKAVTSFLLSETGSELTWVQDVTSLDAIQGLIENEK